MAEEKNTTAKRGRPAGSKVAEGSTANSEAVVNETAGELQQNDASDVWAELNTKNEAFYANQEAKVNFEAYEGDKAFLFVSYSHRDCAKVYAILNELNRLKFRMWYDESMETGSDFRLGLRDKIEKSNGVLFFVSKNSLESRYCGMEIVHALKYTKTIYPIYLEEVVLPPTLDYEFGILHHNTMVNNTAKGLAEELSKYLPYETMARLEYEADGTFLKMCVDNGKDITVDERVERIGKAAFKDSRQLETVKLPKSLQRIDDEAFRACSALKEIEIPEKTTVIGNNAFRDCVKLEKLVIKNELIKIGERAFENCASLTDVSLPGGLRELYAGIFNGCKELKKINLPNKLSVIGENAFVDCISLQEIKFTKDADGRYNIRKIDDFVFSGCTNLQSVELPEGVNKIGKAAFKNCTSLGDIKIPASVNYMSCDLFRGCSGMRSIEVDKKNRYYKSEPIKKDRPNHVLFNKNKSVIIAYPASARESEYEIPDSVTNISEWTFSECKNLEKITIPDSVEKIGEGAFSGCSHITEIEIPDSVREIDDCAFRGCTKLSKLIIPESVEELGWGLFDGCEDKNLKVYCKPGTAIYQYCIDNGIDVKDSEARLEDQYQANE